MTSPRRVAPITIQEIKQTYDEQLKLKQRLGLFRRSSPDSPEPNPPSRTVTDDSGYSCLPKLRLPSLRKK